MVTGKAGEIRLYRSPITESRGPIHEKADNSAVKNDTYVSNREFV